MSAASVHAGLASLVEREGANLEGRRILMYSYGSGLAASLWSVVGRRVEGKFALSSISSKVCVQCTDSHMNAFAWQKQKALIPSSDSIGSVCGHCSSVAFHKCSRSAHLIPSSSEPYFMYGGWIPELVIATHCRS